MKKLKLISYILFYITESFLPIINLLGYRIDTNYVVFAIVCMSVAVSATVFNFKSKVSKKGIAKSIFDLLLLFIAFDNYVLCMDKTPRPVVIVCILICFVCCIIISLSNNSLSKFKYPIAVLSVLLFIFALILTAFSFYVKTETVLSVDSPSGNYYAEVIDTDQGALGGSTHVRVIKRIVKTPVLTLSSYKGIVYDGPWGMFKDMDIYWENDNCLVINSEEYEIK